MSFSEEGKRRLGWGHQPVCLYMDSAVALHCVKRKSKKSERAKVSKDRSDNRDVEGRNGVDEIT